MEHLCDVLATGVFPTLVVTDARCHGSAVGISKKQLWNLFSLDTLVTVAMVTACVFLFTLGNWGREGVELQSPVII